MRQVVDYVSAKFSKDVDYVHRIFGSGHMRYCEYRPSITDNGLVYCDTCSSQIGCVHPECEP